MKKHQQQTLAIYIPLVNAIDPILELHSNNSILIHASAIMYQYTETHVPIPKVQNQILIKVVFQWEDGTSINISEITAQSIQHKDGILNFVVSLKQE